MLWYGISCAAKIQVSFSCLVLSTSNVPFTNILTQCNPQKNTLDVYDTYISFSVTSRIPVMFMFLSTCSLMGFLIIMSASIWPAAVIDLCGVVGVVCMLQYLIYR